MEVALVVLAFLFLLAGFLGSVIPALPGPPLSFVGLLMLQWSGYGNFSPAFLWAWAAVTLVVTIMDNILPMWMTKKFGGSRSAVIGSALGLITGMIFFAPAGLLLGPFLGAFAGELINNYIKTKRSETNSTELALPDSDNTGDTTPGYNSAGTAKALKVAVGAFLAFILGTGVKLIIVSIMIYHAVKAVAFQN